MLLRVVVALCTIATSARAQSQFTPNQKGIEFLKALLLDDAQTYVRGGKSIFEYETLPRILARIEAPQLWEDYNANELAAENKYSGKGIEIRGIVYTVARDPVGVPYVEYASAVTMIDNIRANLADDTVAEAATYKPGQNLVLDCVSVEKGLFSTELTRCRSMSALHAAEIETVEEMVNGFLHGQPSENETPKLRKALFSAYWIGASLPPACVLSPGSGDCLSQFKAAESNLRNDRQFQTAYIRAAPLLELPPLNPNSSPKR